MRKSVLLMASMGLAVLLASGVTLSIRTEPAEAAFPGANGKIAFEVGGFQGYDVRAVDPDGTGDIPLTDNGARVKELDPAWSPDGERVAFVRFDNRGVVPDSNNHEIWVMNSDGSEQKRLTRTPTSDEASPTWSPDGTRIAFHVGTDLLTEDPIYDLYVMDADGTGRTRLTTNPGVDVGPSWSPGGDKIAFTSYRNGRWGAYIMVPAPEGDASRPRRLAGGSASRLDWSPDGRKLAFMADVRPNFHDPVYEIFMMNSDGTERTRLTTNIRNDDRYPVWSPNGKKIAFARGRDVFVMNPVPEGDTNRPRRVTDYVRDGVGFLDWQPIPRR